MAAFFHIPTDVLAYLAQFLNFRDRTALALTCMGFMQTLSDPSVPGLMLGGLRRRLVETAAQFEEWETLARIMPRDHRYVQEMVTRSIWKGSLALGSVFPDKVGTTERALALLRGHDHVLEAFPVDNNVLDEAVEMLQNYSIELCDLALGVFAENAKSFVCGAIGTIMAVANSTRTQDEMETVINLFLPYVTRRWMKEWCHEQGLVALGERLFPDVFFESRPDVTDIALRQFYSSEGVEAILDTMDPKVVCRDLAKRTLANTPKRIMDRYLAPVYMSASDLQNGMMIVKLCCKMLFPDVNAVIWQEIIDEAQGLETETLRHILYRLELFYPPTLDPYHDFVKQRYYGNQFVLPAFDVERYTRNVLLLEQKSIVDYHMMLMQDHPIKHDREVFDVMLNEPVGDIHPIVDSDSIALSLRRAAFAQGRVQEYIAAGFGKWIAVWDGDVNEWTAVWMWGYIQEHECWDFSPVGMLATLPIEHYQEALNLWVADPDQRKPFEFLCTFGNGGALARGFVDPVAHAVEALDYSGLGRMFLEPGVDVVEALGSTIFNNHQVRAKFLAVIDEYDLYDTISDAHRPNGRMDSSDPTQMGVRNTGRLHVLQYIRLANVARASNQSSPGPR